MRYYLNFLFFVIFFYDISYSQVLNGKIIDADLNCPIDLASVFFQVSKFTVFSDSDGKFSVEINVENTKESLVISSIGYEDIEVDLKKFSENINYDVIFKLIPKIHMIDEIIISNEKIDYSWTKNINSKRKPYAGFSFQFGTENVRFVENPYFKSGRIKKVILSLDKLEKNKDIPKWKMDYITAYNIKFYKYDARNQKPGEELYNKNIIVEPGNKTQDLKINVDSLNISFPKEGVCIGVEYVNTKYANIKTNSATIGPFMNFYKEEKLKPITSWTRNRAEDWEFKTSISNFKNRRYQNVMVVDLEVNLEK